jgi:predicted nuclease with TOPRIM domain
MSSGLDASISGATHIDTVVSDAQHMVANLTSSVKSLREEKKVLKTSLDRCVEENIQVRQKLADVEHRVQQEADDFNLQIAHAAALNTKLQERCDKLELLVKLGDLKRQELAQEASASAKERRADQQRVEKLQATIRAEKDALVARTNAVQADNTKLRNYCSELEKESLHQWEQRCGVIEDLTSLQADYDLLKKEVAILKVLGVSAAHSKGVRSLAPMTTDKERFLLLKHELSQAAEFLRHASIVADST